MQNKLMLWMHVTGFRMHRIISTIQKYFMKYGFHELYEDENEVLVIENDVEEHSFKRMVKMT